MTTYPGGCHCGAIRMTYRSARPAAEHTLRACQCRFCSKHASRAVSDPDGLVQITILDGMKMSPYRFGFATADYIVCRECGVYVAAVMTEGERSWSVTIVNALEDAADFTGPVVPVDFSAEEKEERLARRRAGWTPTIFARHV
jgi:hypothetical protein